MAFAAIAETKDYTKIMKLQIIASHTSSGSRMPFRTIFKALHLAV